MAQTSRKGPSLKTRCPASPPGGRQQSSPEAGEQDLKVFIGPKFALRAQRRTDMANQKLPGTNTVELIFAPAAAAIVFIKETGEDTGVPLANEAMIPMKPASQPVSREAVNGLPRARGECRKDGRRWRLRRRHLQTEVNGRLAKRRFLGKSCRSVLLFRSQPE